MRTLEIQLESSFMQALCGESCSDFLLGLRLAIQQQETSPSRSRDFASECTPRARDPIEVIDTRVGDLIRHRTLCLPTFVKEAAESAQVAPFECFPHALDKIADRVQGGEGQSR